MISDRVHCVSHSVSLQRLLEELGNNSTHSPYLTEYYVGDSRSEMILPLEADVLTHCEPTPQVKPRFHVGKSYILTMICVAQPNSRFYPTTICTNFCFIFCTNFYVSF